MTQTATKGFYKLCLVTLVAVYFLIAVGGIVRTTGSGMGCPDWPRCFGKWVPPTSVSQLPTDYKETFAKSREKKNEKFAKYLSLLGMTETATKLLADKSILIEADFNPVKTWIEYLNRLLGAVIGLLILILFGRSVKFYKTHSRIFWVSLGILIAVLFQGWFGSIVVSTNLTTWTITLHMLIALLIVSLLNYLLVISRFEILKFTAPVGSILLVLGCSIILLAQILLGTQVREAIDSLAHLSRNSWISSLGIEFIIHRSFSWLVVGMHIWLLIRLRETTVLKTLTRALFVLILCSFLTGVSLAYLDVPAFLQPLHLVLAAICFGLQQYLLFSLAKSRLEVVQA